MQANIGRLDKLIRVTLAIIIAILYFSSLIDGVVAAVLGMVAIIFIASSMVGVCPLYWILRLSTR